MINQINKMNTTFVALMLLCEHKTLSLTLTICDYTKQLFKLNIIKEWSI